MASAKVDEKKKIRLFKTVVHLGMLGTTIWLLTLETWIGAAFALFWYLMSDVIPVAVLAPFFGVERVKQAFWGDMVLEPPEKQPAPGARDELLGSVGHASTELHPEGYVVVDGRRYPARSDGRVLQARTEVVVVDSRLGMLIVMPRAEVREQEP